MKPYFDSFLKIIGQDYFTFSSSVLPKKNHIVCIPENVKFYQNMNIKKKNSYKI